MTSKLKTVRTKVTKSERVEFRCTTAFKAALTEIAELNGVTVTALVEGLCTDKIQEHFRKVSVQNVEQLVATEPTPKPIADTPVDTPKIAHTNDYEAEIERMLVERKSVEDTIDWLNANGYKPQRSDRFNKNNVRAIRKRLEQKRANA